MRDVLVVNVFEFTQTLTERNTRLEQSAIRILQRPLLLFSKTSPRQSNGIQPPHAGRISVSNKERQHILHDLRLPANHRVTTEPHKLMRAHVVRKKHVVLYCDMSRQRHFIGENVVVADRAVVRHVYPNHEEVARADARRLPCPVRAMKSAKLAHDVVVADLEKALFAFELDVLRLAAKHGVFVDAIPGPEPRKPLDYGISADLAIQTDFHVRFDYGGRMNRHLQGFEDNRVL